MSQRIRPRHLRAADAQRSQPVTHSSCRRIERQLGRPELVRPVAVRIRRGALERSRHRGELEKARQRGALELLSDRQGGSLS